MANPVISAVNDYTCFIPNREQKRQRIVKKKCKTHVRFSNQKEYFKRTPYHCLAFLTVVSYLLHVLFAFKDNDLPERDLTILYREFKQLRWFALLKVVSVCYMCITKRSSNILDSQPLWKRILSFTICHLHTLHFRQTWCNIGFSCRQ